MSDTTTTSHRRRWFTVAIAAAVATVAMACSADEGADSPPDAAPATPAAAVTSLTGDGDDGLRTVVRSDDGSLIVETTSSRASMVTGGDVLVTVSGPAAATAAVTLNGSDVTDSLLVADATVVGGDNPGRRGLITGLNEGDNTVVVASGDATVELTVVNHPTTGPIFSGPHLSPWVCETEVLGLGPALDDDCSVAPVTSWSYVTTDGILEPLEPPFTLPDDAAEVEVEGTTWPAVVRTERGVINRGIYTIWILDPGVIDQPTELQAAGVAPTWQSAAFNGRLVYRFGGGCGTTFTQGALFEVLSGGPDLNLLSQGYAVATNTLNTLQTACNPVLSAETMFMTREHFIKRYSPVEFTIGDGASGGAIQQLSIASAYPGALDAISAALPYPDALSLAPSVTDCGLLLDYFDSPTGRRLTSDQRRAISGHASEQTCTNWSDLFLDAVKPTVGCGPQLADEVYDPDTNPTGVRCTLQDINVNVLGRNPATGFARRPLDNVGVQYGLGALAAGNISVDEFLDLNEGMGSYDIDGNIVAGRTAADPDSLATLYAVGGIADGPGLFDLPIILRNVYLDDVGDIHTRVWAFSIRERLNRDGTDADNLLLWTDPGAGGIEALLGAISGEVAGADAAVVLLDNWLTEDQRPEGATNVCVLPDGTRLTGGWELYDEAGPCAAAYPVSGEPRFVAGQPLAATALACQRTPVDPDTYPVALDDAQAERLAALFPDGVCDWTLPGIDQQAAAATWVGFGR